MAVSPLRSACKKVGVNFLQKSLNAILLIEHMNAL